MEVNSEILYVYGNANQGTIIADIPGAKLAIRAYDHMMANSKEELKLPGLPYTPRQLFWLSAAMPYCFAAKPEYLKNLLSTNFDTPWEVIVNGAFKNRKEFSRDWNCSIGDEMNPIHKCEVW